MFRLVEAVVAPCWPFKAPWKMVAKTGEVVTGAVACTASWKVAWAAAVQSTVLWVRQMRATCRVQG